jgi:hypothetical protein
LALSPRGRLCLALRAQAFKQIDKDGSGTISVAELEGELKKFGIYDDAKELLSSADTNGDGLIGAGGRGKGADGCCCPGRPAGSVQGSHAAAA